LQAVHGLAEDRMVEDERSAIALLQRGDISGLETLVRVFHARAVRCAYLVTQDVDTAQDVAQAAFLKAYEHIGQFDARRPFGPWFLKSVLRDAVKAANRRRRQVPLDPSVGEESRSTAEQTVDPDPGPASLWDQQETAQAVAKALVRLPARERAAIVQRYYLGLTEAEMAQATDCPPGTIKSRLNAARERLRVLLQPLRQDSEVL
jgi:RNA polymerase sigma-70 factor, ECF subfamily